MQLSYKIWFVGCAVWLLDSAVSFYYGSRPNAAIALLIAVLFLMAGMYFRPRS